MEKILNSKKLIATRDLTLNLVAKEIKLRYMGAILGFIWSLGNPLAVALTYFIVFSYILPSSEDRFALHLLTGVFHWMLVNQILSQSCDWLLNNANLIRKIRFPHLLLPLSGVLTVTVFWLAAMFVYLLVFQFLGGEFSYSMLIYPLVVALFLAFISGIGLVLSVIQISFRDMRHIVDVLLPLLFWFTPIVWSIRSVPEKVIPYLYLNPFLPYFRSFDAILLRAELPTAVDFILVAVLGTVSLAFGLFTFRRSINLVELL